MDGWQQKINYRPLYVLPQWNKRLCNLVENIQHKSTANNGTQVMVIGQAAPRVSAL